MNQPRGYLLIEAAIAGCMVAVALGIAFTLIAGAKREVAYGNRHAVAASLASAKAQELASASTLTAQPLGAFVPVGPDYPGLRMRFSVTPSASVAASNPPIVSALFEIVVEVEVPTASGSDIVTYRTLQKD